MNKRIFNIHAASLLRNSTYRMTGFMMSILFMLLFTPYFVKILGPEQYGLWAISISVLGFAGMLDWGIGTAVTKYVSHYLSLGNPQKLAECILASTIIYLFLGTCGTIFLWIFAPQVVSRFAMSPVLVPIGIKILRITALGILPMFLRNCFLAVPMGFQKYGFSTAITLTKELVGMGGMAFILWLGGRLIGVVSWMVIVSVGIALITIIIGLSMIKSADALMLSFRKDAFVEIIRFAIYSGTTGVGSRIFNILDRIIVGILLNTSMVTYYVIPISLANKLRGIISNISHVFMPRASSLQAKCDYDKIRSLFLKSHKLMAYVLFGLTCVLFIVSKPLLLLWLGPDFVLHSLTPLRILLVAYAFISLAAPSFYFANGLGMPWINAFSSVLGGMLSIGFMWFIGRYGLDYFAWANWGFIIVLLIPAVIMKKIGFRIFHDSLNIISRPLGVFIILVGGFLFFEDHISPWLWAGMAIIIYILIIFHDCRQIIKRFLNKAPYFKDLFRLQGQLEKP
ncbi:MAG: oligosaccharide flippase family protein [bacterium]